MRRATRTIRRQLAVPSAAVAALLSGDAQAWPTQPGELVNPLVIPEACEFCHNYVNADVHDNDPRYAPMRTWRGTMMANSARDPVFWAGIAVADQDVPGATDLCVRCHSPRAFLEGNGGALAFDDLTLEQKQGVECEVCHRMMDEGNIGNAQYTIDDVFLGSEVARRGPWGTSDYAPATTVDPPPHEFIADPFTGSSQLCGTCHDVTTSAERVDDAGVGMGFAFNEQRTYSEWLGSAYAQPGAGFQSCGDCHLPEVADMPGCTEKVNQQSHPVGGRRHDLVGANRFMVEMLKTEFGSAGTNSVGDIYYDTTLERMDEFLPTAATLEVTAPTEIDLEVGLSDIAVTVTNNSGHKLPTGYSEGRVMWIEVLGEYAGQRVFSSGAWEQATGEIEADAQVRRYEAIGEQWLTGIELHLLLNDHWVLDNRIPPAGLMPDLQTDPVGDRYTLQTDGTWPNFDATSYDFAATPELYDATPEDPTDDELTLTVRVQYVINTSEYIEFLADNGGMNGAHVADLFELAGGATPNTIAEEVISIPITNFGSEPPADTGDGDGDAGDGDGDTTAASSTETSAGDEVGTGSGDETPMMDEGGAGPCTCSTDPAEVPRGLAVVPWVLVFAGRRRRKRRQLPSRV